MTENEYKRWATTPRLGVGQIKTMNESRENSGSSRSLVFLITEVQKQVSKKMIYYGITTQITIIKQESQTANAQCDIRNKKLYLILQGITYTKL